MCIFLSFTTLIAFKSSVFVLNTSISALAIVRLSARSEFSFSSVSILDLDIRSCFVNSKISADFSSNDLFICWIFSLISSIEVCFVPSSSTNTVMSRTLSLLLVIEASSSLLSSLFSALKESICFVRSVILSDLTFNDAALCLTSSFISSSAVSFATTSLPSSAIIREFSSLVTANDCFSSSSTMILAKAILSLSVRSPSSTAFSSSDLILLDISSIIICFVAISSFI